MPEELEGFSLILKRWLPALIWMILILLFSLDWGSGSHTYRIIRPLMLWLDPATPDSRIYEVNFAVRKTAHALEFAILAILIWRAHTRKFQPVKAFDLRGIGFTLLVALIFAVASEGIQFFVATRTSSIKDIFLNMGGATLGLLVAYLHRLSRLLRRRPLNPPPLEPVTKPKKNTLILFAADLHLPGDATASTPALARLKSAVEESRPDAVVIAGDIGPALQAQAILSALSEAVGPTPLALCLGNQDHWLPKDRWDDFPDLESIRTGLWHPAASSAGIVCLDFDNLPVGHVVLTGGYGHYDLKMRSPEIRAGGQSATLDDYLSGSFAGLVWNDALHIPRLGESIGREAQFQADGIAGRLAQAVATNQQVLVVTHTVPFPALIGRTDKPDSLLGFLDAYAGNSQVGAVLADQADHITLAVCGHTRSHVLPQNVQGVPCMNLGHRLALYDSYTRTIRELS